MASDEKSATLVVDNEDDSVVGVERKKGIKEILATRIAKKYRFCVFRGDLYLESRTKRWEKVDSDDFSRICYKTVGLSLTKAQISEIHHLIRNVCADLSLSKRYIAFSDGTVFDTKTLDFCAVPYEDTFFRIDYSPAPLDKATEPIKFIKEICSNDVGVYNDVMQSISTMFMLTKPVGVIWWHGDGSNGKSSISHFLKYTFKNLLADIGVDQLAKNDGADAPMLNGKIANVQQESSDSVVRDSKIYKNIGTHDDFFVHKYFSQDSMVVDGNVAHIFSCNKIPTFMDKTNGARRRTIVIRFREKFAENNTFESSVFTKENAEILIAQMIIFARKIKSNGVKYKWSEKTLEDKSNYDKEANSAVEFVHECINNGLIGALNYRSINNYYTEWCDLNSMNVLSKTTLKNELSLAGFSLKSQRDALGRARKVVVLDGYSPMDLNFNGTFYGTAWLNGRPDVINAGSFGDTGMSGSGAAIVGQLNGIMKGETDESKGEQQSLNVSPR